MDKFIRRTEKVFTSLAMASAFFMVCLTAVDAGGRYFLNKPVAGAFEITENFLMVFLVYFALAYTYREGANIRVTFLVSRFPPQMKLVIDTFVQIFSFCFIVFLCLSATRLNLNRLSDVLELTMRLRVPKWPSYMVISVTLLFLSLLILLDLRNVKKGKSGLFKEDSSEKSMSL